MEVFKKKGSIKDGIIQFEVNENITKKVADFYRKNPFPNYDNNEDKYSLTSKGDKNKFEKD